MKNIYEQFIEHLTKEEKKLNLNDKNLEKHHILPLHSGGQKDGPVVLCTQKNHTLAHYYRYLVYKERGDKVAYIMRWNQKLGIRERSLLAVEKNRKLKNLFWNSNWQSEQGKKGGLKGGKANTFAQKKSRQQIGLTYGEKSKNASNKLKTILKKKTVWIYKLKNQQFIIVKIAPQKSFSKLIKILSNISQKKINNSSFYKVIHGERKQMYDWSLIFIIL
jgi:hypothetical protein